MRLGIHASLRRGFPNALKDAGALGCEAIQIFPYRPGEPFRFLSEAELSDFQKLRKEFALQSLILHSVFQPNIASTNEKIRQRSRDSLLEEYRFAHAVQADSLIIHSGSYSPDSNLREGLKKSGRTIRWALEQCPSKTKIILENVGGGARRMGGKFEELKILLNEIGMENRTAICLDTAHAFAAGYLLNVISGLEDCLAEIDRTVGLARLDVFHLNDTLAELGSHKDIHQHIGRGLIGVEPLKKLTLDRRFAEKAGILETPHLPLGSDRKNLDLLRQ